MDDTMSLTITVTAVQEGIYYVNYTRLNCSQQDRPTQYVCVSMQLDIVVFLHNNKKNYFYKYYSQALHVITFKSDVSTILMSPPHATELSQTLVLQS